MMSRKSSAQISVTNPWIALAVLCLMGIVVSTLPALAQQKSAEKDSSAASRRPNGKAFRTPTDAAAALYGAARRDDENEILKILGPDAKQLISWTSDPNERAEERKTFADKYDQMHRLVKEPDDTVALYVGSENWPVPIPIVQYNGKWYFDTVLGTQEVRYRQIGRNEMHALEVCNALVDAEKDYYSAQHKYTANFVSDSNSHDGLYWKTSANAKASPIGPYLAHAGVGESSKTAEPYYGYYYRIVLSPNSSGDARFAVLAFPAEYRSSGVMTFLVQQDGLAYEKDLGPKTDQVAKQMTETSPGSSWTKVE